MGDRGFHLITESSFATLCGAAPSRTTTTTPQSPRDHLKSLQKHFREFVALLEKCEAHFSPTDAVERGEHAYVLNNTKLAGNGATEAASEIFVSEPSTLKICCGKDCFTGSSLTHAPSCSSQYQKRGPSEAMAVGGGMDRVVSHPSTIEGYSSGEVLEPIEVVLLDSFGQPAFENVTLRMELATSGGDLSGNPVTENGVLMSSQFVVEGVVLRAMPGTYNVSFSFTPNEEGGKFLSTSITIVVRECVVGEVSKDDGRRCEKCKPGFFSFDTSDKNCELCPGKKATCYGSTLSPADGFWHSAPHSTDVHSCLLEEACTYDNRTEILQESSLRNGAIIDSGEGYPQCAQGYEGVHCGSCAPTHGKERSLRCVECGAKSSSGLMCGAVMLALLIISMVYVRSVRVHSKKVIAQANAALPSRGGSEHVLEVEGDNLPCIENQGGEQKNKAAFSDVIKAHRCRPLNLIVSAQWLDKGTNNKRDMAAASVDQTKNGGASVSPAGCGAEANLCPDTGSLWSFSLAFYDSKLESMCDGVWKAEEIDMTS
ncbi:hypothetical protein BSKO_05566 [Bryopsis sp. KO-2023]|nr:hypothetical protein BSKO_05566 [Bryopsis sp. KO-2023]